ncbi:MAG: hypothetical protein LBK82_11775, partial [Planctomycetaceae bacterium]|nr:hypothetical protein [Planctomycetaceae bacterium]
RRTIAHPIKSPAGTRLSTIMKSSRPCRALLGISSEPAVALRSTAGYAHHAPCGATENIF